MPHYDAMPTLSRTYNHNTIRTIRISFQPSAILAVVLFSVAFVAGAYFLG